MKFKKKWLAMLMVLTMVLSLALTGCNKSNDNDENELYNLKESHNNFRNFYSFRYSLGCQSGGR